MNSQVGELGILSGAAIALIIPMGAWMGAPAIGHYMPLPQAWTLSTELLFHALLPFLMRSKILKWPALVVGFVTFVAATANYINADYFSYRLLPGTLTFFLRGHALFEKEHKMAVLIVFVLVADLVSLSLAGRLSIAVNTALFISGFAAAPLILASKAMPSGRLDRMLGSASHGCNLSHWLFLAWLQPYSTHRWSYLAICLPSTATAWMGSKLLEEPVARFRRQLATPLPAHGQTRARAPASALIANR